MQYLIKNDKIMCIMQDSVMDNVIYNNFDEVIVGMYIPNFNNKTKSELLSKLNITQSEANIKKKELLETVTRNIQYGQGCDDFFLSLCYIHKDSSTYANEVVVWCDNLWNALYHTKKDDIVAGITEINIDENNITVVPRTFTEVRVQLGV